jgi:hypothetical protein
VKKQKDNSVPKRRQREKLESELEAQEGTNQDSQIVSVYPTYNMKRSSLLSGRGWVYRGREARQEK